MLDGPRKTARPPQYSQAEVSPLHDSSRKSQRLRTRVWMRVDLSVVRSRISRMMGSASQLGFLTLKTRLTLGFLVGLVSVCHNAEWWQTEAYWCIHQDR